MKWGRKALARSINDVLERYTDFQENQHLIREAVMFVYTGVSGLSIFSGPQNSLGEKIWRRLFIHSLPSGSRSALRRNFWRLIS